MNEAALAAIDKKEKFRLSQLAVGFKPTATATAIATATSTATATATITASR